MFGIDKDKIKAAFSEFNGQLLIVAGDDASVSPDPVVRLIVKFIQALSKAFD